MDGRRAYDRVRAGERVDLAPRSVVVSRLDVTDVRRLPEFVDVDVVVECSTGTYVRAIARDLGEALGVGGHLTELRRTRVGPFAEHQARTLAEIEETGESALLSMDEVALATFPVWRLDETQAAYARTGRRIAWSAPGPAGPTVALLGPDGEFIALAEDDAGTARYLAVFA